MSSGPDSSASHPRKFSLRWLLAAAIWIAIALAVCSRYLASGVTGGALVVAGLYAILALGAVVDVHRRIYGGVALCLAGASLFVLSKIEEARETSRRATCYKNISEISKAIYTYRAIRGNWPPAFVADQSGRPLHSWRVLILPYLGYQNIYDAYHFDEPWDGPNNRKLHGLMLEVFRCPSEGGNSSDTSYVAIVGPQTAWPGPTSAPNTFPDGEGRTLLVVETRDSDIHWMEPRDITVEQLVGRVNPQTGSGSSSSHPGTVWVSFADHCCRELPKRLTSEQLRALLTIDGGEPIDFLE
jgi:hypothetical protein